MNPTIIAEICSVLSTLAECGGCPASTIYLALGADMPKWESVRDIMVGQGMITISPSHWVTITPKGIDLARKVDAILLAPKR